jgi:transposase-like protein
MNTAYRKFTAKFKAQVTFEAIKDRDSLSRITKLFEVHLEQITFLQRELSERAKQSFGGTTEDLKLTAFLLQFGFSCLHSKAIGISDLNQHKIGVT